MTDTPPPAAHQPRIEEPDQPGRLRRVVSAVWLVPIVAVVIAGAIAWQSFRDRGTLIAVAFPNVAGIAPGETTLRYREVVVGVVEDVGFTADLSLVNVYVRVNKDIAPFLDEDASFWIVQPEVSARGVSGLSTILSGIYIEGTWDAQAGEPRTAFLGDDRAPTVPPDTEGTVIVLRARDSNRLEAGAPILFKGIEVGETSNPRLSRDGTEVRMDAFVRAPYDQQLSTATRFWDVSGVSATLGGSGVELRVQSLASILEGGLNFDTLVSGGSPIEDGHVFDIFADEDTARASAFELPSARSVAVSALFPAAATGLTDGAPVRYRGVRVGLVTDVTGYIRPDDDTRAVQLLVRMALQPARMGLDVVGEDLDAIDYIGDLVAGGMRAQLVSTSLLGGDLAVDLVEPEGVPSAVLEVGIADTPLIPTVAGDNSSFADTAEGVLARLNDLPIEELMGSATDLLDNLNRIAADPDTRALPGEVRDTVEQAQGLVRDGRAIVSSPDVAAVLLDVRTIADDLQGIVAEIAAQRVAERLSETLAAATEAAGNVAAGTVDLPDLTAAARSAIDSADAILSSEDAQALPSVARSALAGIEGVTTAPELRTILADAAASATALRATAEEVAAAGLAARLSDALADVQSAAANVAEGTADLGPLRDSLQNAVAAAEAILADPDTAALPAAARGALQGVDELVSDPALDALLADLAATAAETADIAAQLNAEGAAQALTATLQDAQRAAAAVAEGAAEVPLLTEQAGRVLDEVTVLTKDLQGLTAKAQALELEGLIASATQFLDSADAFISSDEADDVPPALVDTLEEIRLLVESVRTGPTLDNLNSTLASASGAARSVDIAAQNLPDLLTRLSALSNNAGALLTTYSDGSRFSTDLIATLDAVASAAEEIEKLARTLERNPNALIFGR
ncbi:MCE family protein [Jannaschia sp. Os4]|uniref:PqiB family protein n=1 Tax=Jannaschia sp. Os4 TaxID=2807617 RepID=UPI0019399EB2|nr:MlaD family protein [Jannaschia sp. Os4]MBM2574901.1 MCE family protein [Jannaschia sp. Os4]